jgi:hypothetical protein
LILVVGVRTFGAAGDSLLLLQYAAADRGAAMMRLATLVSVSCGYPLIFQVVRDMLLQRVLPPSPSPATRRALSLALLGSMTATGRPPCASRTSPRSSRCAARCSAR